MIFDFGHKREQSSGANVVTASPMYMPRRRARPLWFHFVCHDAEDQNPNEGTAVNTIANTLWIHFSEAMSENADLVVDTSHWVRKERVLKVTYAAAAYSINIDVNSTGDGKFNGVIHLIASLNTYSVHPNFARLVLDCLKSAPGISDVDKGMYFPYSWNATFTSNQFRLDSLDLNALPKLDGNILTGNVLVDCLTRSNCKIRNGRAASPDKLHLSISHRGDWMYVNVERANTAHALWTLDMTLMKGLPRIRPTHLDLIEHVNLCLTSEASIQNVVWHTAIEFEDAWEASPIDLE